ncbi:MAG TPA: MFS transporter, partial [Candidatus Limnocylindrales bacterium]
MATTATPPRPSGSKALGGVLANPGIRRVEIAWTAGLAADWAYLVVLLVVAYKAGGPIAVGVLGLVRMVPTIVLGAVVPAVIERTRGDRALLAVHAVRAFAALGTAAAIATGVPLPVTFVLAAVVTGAGSLVRPIQSSLMPALARTPEELVASNVASSSGEGLGTFAGPLIGGLVLAAAGAGWACGVIALIAFGSTAALGRMHWARGVHGPDRRRAPAQGLGSGIRALVGHRTAAVIVADFVGQSFVRGLMNTLLVVASIELLGLGDGGVGLLNTAIGAGGFVGALIALGLATRPRLAPAFAVALAMWSLPLAVIGVVSLPVLAIAALVVTGTSNAVLDVAGFTLMQRGVPGGSRMAAFGLLESVAAVGVALGSVTAPILLATAGTRSALIISGLSLPILALVSWPQLSGTADDSMASPKVVALLRRIPLFEPLGLTAIEALDPIGSCQASTPQLGSKSWPLRQTPQTRLSALRMQWPSAFILLLPAA